MSWVTIHNKVDVDVLIKKRGVKRLQSAILKYLKIEDHFAAKYTKTNSWNENIKLLYTKLLSL